MKDKVPVVIELKSLQLVAGETGVAVTQRRQRLEDERHVDEPRDDAGRQGVLQNPRPPAPHAPAQVVQNERQRQDLKVERGNVVMEEERVVVNHIRDEVEQISADQQPTATLERRPPVGRRGRGGGGRGR